MSLRVVKPGPRTLLQDDGRPGHADQGVGESGAFDRAALRAARAAVGAPEDAVLEVTMGGLRLEADAEHRLVVTGAPCTVTVDGEEVEHGQPFDVPQGASLRFGRPSAGLRSYVAVAGGFAVEPVLGSRSTDTLSGLGPAPLAAGDVLPVGDAAGRAAPDDEIAGDAGDDGNDALEVVLGPRDDWFTDAAVERFLSASWSVSQRSDRVGVRLEGPALERRVREELPSEPCVRGSVQITADGLPVVFGPDHPVTGGYPVIAVVTGAGMDRLAQARPGSTLRFTTRP